MQISSVGFMTRIIFIVFELPTLNTSEFGTCPGIFGRANSGPKIL